jgi:hypothetical protein
MPHATSRTAPADPAARTPAGQTSITIRDGASPYGRDLSFPQAIGQLRDGEQVTVVPSTPAPPSGTPAASPCSASTSPCTQPARAPTGTSRPKVNWGSKGAVPAANAALFAETLTLASRLAMYAGLGEATAATQDEAARRA